MLSQFFQRLILTSVVVASCLATPFTLSLPSDQSHATPAAGIVFAQEASTNAASRDHSATPLSERTYAGTSQCFICHRPQTNTWSETKHAHEFTDLPDRYRSDPACLTCHTTGFGTPSGYAPGTDKDLAMVGCESCHGPGAQHIEAAQRFVMATTDAAAIEQEMRDTIVKTPTDAVCTRCHAAQAHGRHPPYEGQVVREAARGTAGGAYGPCMLSAPCGPWTTSTSAPVDYTAKYSVKTCGGCHYDQYKQWSASAHSDLFAVLPDAYRNDQECQKCHPKVGAVAERTTGGTDPHHDLLGVACESCHGPALAHVQFTKQFISTPPLGPALEQKARNAISQGKPTPLCVQCHLSQRHQQHPEFAEN